MNICKILSKIILLSTALVYQNTTYSSNITEELRINEFSHDNLAKYDQIDSNDAIYRLDYDNNKIYPTYDGYKLYDLKTKVEKSSSDNLSLVESGCNLIIKKLNDETNKTYTITDINNSKGTKKYLQLNVPSNTNFIIPETITLDSKDVLLNFSNNNYMLIVLGNINNKSQIFNDSFIKFSPNSELNSKIIIGLGATYTWAKENTLSPICMNKNSQMVLYPGCQIKDWKNTQNSHYDSTIIFDGKIYLNRYLGPNDIQYYYYDYLQQYMTFNNTLLNGDISSSVNIVFPKYLARDQNNKLSEWGDNYILYNDNTYNGYVKTIYFPELYWKGYMSQHTVSNDINKSGSYYFEEPVPIEFINNGSGK